MSRTKGDMEGRWSLQLPINVVYRSKRRIKYMNIESGEWNEWEENEMNESGE